MYNKLYTKILDSSIWLEPNPTRIVWITFLAAMNEDGFAQFSSVRNLANRAMVTPEEAEIAVQTLESPDADSNNKANDGRRIERVPGGWMILNAGDYKDIVTRMESLRLNRERVARHRAKRAAEASRNASGNGAVMQSEALSGSEALSKKGNPDMPRKLGTARKKAPEDFAITDALREWAWKNCPGVDLDRETEAFKDYTFASGKTDWPATWRSWMRKANKGGQRRLTRYEESMAELKRRANGGHEPAASPLGAFGPNVGTALPGPVRPLS